MAIAEAKLEAGAIEYINSGFNKTKTALTMNPHLSLSSADAHCTDLVGKSGIEQRAFEIIKEREKLQLESALKKLEESLDATKTVFYKGRCYDDIADNPIRLDATKFLIEKVHGLGKSNNNINFNDNRSLNINVDIDKLSAVTTELKQLTAQAASMLTKFDKCREI